MNLKEKHKPIIIAGPCSAESKEQVFQTAKQIARSISIDYFRAGVWKPRTRPGSFEGKGIEALQWLQDIKTEFNLPVCIEVIQPKHIELALKHNIDAVWIGARTTTNPYSINEIAQALQNIQIPVMIKNPMHPEINLWMGAIERIKNSGIQKIIAIHRGFYYYGNDKYRNKPLWQVPLELKTIFPDIPIICDPSHIAGKREYIFEIAQKAMNIGLNGLMIETHSNPSLALSDKDQQITPDELKKLLDKIKFLNNNSSDPVFENTLQNLRQIIDEIDEDILTLLSKRFDVVKQIAYYKKNQNVTAFQLSRWKDILTSRKKLAKELQINDNFVHHFLSLLHEESINIQNKILNEPQTEQTLEYYDHKRRNS